MNILALYALLAAVGAAIGSGLTHYVDSRRIDELETEITNANLEAEAKLAIETAKVAGKTLENQILNQKMEKKHEELALVNNSLHDQLASVRLRPAPSRKSCRSSASAGASTGKPEDQTDELEFPTRIHEFLVPRTATSDANTLFALECWSFINERNCGIPLSTVKVEIK